MVWAQTLIEDNWVGAYKTDMNDMSDKNNDKTLIRIACICCLILVFLIVGINTYKYYSNPKDEQEVDSNVYLNEEVCFAKEVYISVTGINVEKVEDVYKLNLVVNVEQRCVDGKPDKVEIEPKNFVLKSVNIKAKSHMAIFFESLFKASISMMISGAIEGSINIIEETISFVGDYTSETIVNAIDADTKFKNVDADNTFELFYPRDITGISTLNLSFTIRISDLEKTDNIIVLTIDQWNHVERRIFLILRPE